MSSDLSGIFDFLFFWGKGERGKGFRVANVNWGFGGSASYQQVTSKLEGGGSMGGIKVEFGGFIGGFGKIFFTKGGIKREKEGFWGCEEGKEERIYIFLKIFKGVEKSSKLYRGMYFWVMDWEGKEKRRKGIGFLGYVWERMICTLYGNKSELQ